jgi:hypothetical protein
MNILEKIKNLYKPQCNFCLSRNEEEKIKSLDLEKIVRMENDERLKIFAQIVSEERAEWLNGRFDKDFVLAAQKNRLLNFLDKKCVERGKRKEFVNEIARLEKPLNKEVEDVYFKKIVKLDAETREIEEVLRRFSLNYKICYEYQEKIDIKEKDIRLYESQLYSIENHRLLRLLRFILIASAFTSLIIKLRMDNASVVDFVVIGVIVGPVIYVISYIFIWLLTYITKSKIYDSLSGGEYSKLVLEKNRLKQELVRIVEEIENKKKAITDFYKTQLEDFKSEKLYRQRSGSEIFEKDLLKYKKILDGFSNIMEFFHIKNNLIFQYWHEHWAYFQDRKYNHEEMKGVTHERGLRSEYIKNSSDSIKEPQNEQKLNKTQAPLEIEYQKSKKVNSEKLPPRFIGRKIDWKALSESQRLTGENGEELVFELQKEYLCANGRLDLSEKVRWMSKEEGDGLGYDILSFSIDGKEKYIEVKSTTSSIESSFYMTQNEISFLESHKDNSYVYRVALAKDVANSLLQVFPSNNFLEISERTPIMFRVQM